MNSTTILAQLAAARAWVEAHPDADVIAVSAGFEGPKVLLFTPGGVEGAWVVTGADADSTHWRLTADGVIVCWCDLHRQGVDEVAP